MKGQVWPQAMLLRFPSGWHTTCPGRGHRSEEEVSSCSEERVSTLEMKVWKFFNFISIFSRGNWILEKGNDLRMCMSWIRMSDHNKGTKMPDSNQEVSCIPTCFHMCVQRDRQPWGFPPGGQLASHTARCCGGIRRT